MVTYHSLPKRYTQVIPKGIYQYCQMALFCKTKKRRVYCKSGKRVEVHCVSLFLRVEKPLTRHIMKTVCGNYFTWQKINTRFHANKKVRKIKVCCSCSSLDPRPLLPLPPRRTARYSLQLCICTVAILPQFSVAIAATCKQSREPCGHHIFTPRFSSVY